MAYEREEGSLYVLNTSDAQVPGASPTREEMKAQRGLKHSQVT